MNLTCFAWVHIRRAPLKAIVSQATRLQAVLGGILPPWDLLGLKSAQALADFVRLPPMYLFTDKDLAENTSLDLMAIASVGGAAGPIFWLIPVLSLCSGLPAACPIEDVIAYIGTLYLGNQKTAHRQAVTPAHS